jgi:hypothetical protein
VPQKAREEEGRAEARPLHRQSEEHSQDWLCHKRQEKRRDGLKPGATEAKRRAQPGLAVPQKAREEEGRAEARPLQRQSEEHSQDWLCHKCEERFMEQNTLDAAEYLDCAGRGVRRSKRGRKSRPAALGMTVGLDG